jgi:uracil-DNA glycosylase
VWRSNNGLLYRFSLQEMEEDPDVKFTKPKHGDLTKWAKQGVLLLNTVLTVRGGSANSHAKKGWELFTDMIIDAVNKQSKHGVVFMLWGLPSQKKADKINLGKHCVLKAAHPSPLSASKGFFGCKHFSKANKWLKEKGLPQIDWQL